MTRIALLSDSHDNLPALRAALAQVQDSGATTLLHMGDLSAPFVVNELGKSFGGPIHIVFGNNDADLRLIQVNASKYPQITLHGIYAEVEVEGRQIAMIHYPEPARRIAQSGVFALVAYGHNHTRKIERIGNTWLVNPGELLGLMGEKTWALYDTEADRVELVSAA
jgi:putative phosphoesterase